MDSQTALIIALQTNLPDLTPIASLISIFGMPEFYLMVIPFILWCYDKKLGLRLVFLLSISTCANAIFKIFFHTPRPYWINSEVKAFASEPSFGLPSGHAQTSLIFLGYIGSYIKKINIWIICIILIILVAISRLYLGVHFLTDILAGWFFGLIILVLFLHYENSIFKWYTNKSFRNKILIAFFSSLLLIVLSQISIISLGTWQLPIEWSTLAFSQTNVTLNPISLRDTLMAAGIFFGAAVGACTSSHFFPYLIHGNYTTKITRYIIGIFILALIWIILSSLTKSTDNIGYGMTYLRAVLAGLWVTGGAPLLFRKLGLISQN